MTFHPGEPRIPAGPFYHGVAREDQIPVAPMSPDGEGLDEVAPARAAAGPPTLTPGEHVGALSHLVARTPNLLVGYPLRIYELRDLVGLRIDGSVTSYRYLVADDAIVAREVPAWHYFGPHGEGVPDVLEAIWTLDPDRVSKLRVPPGDHPFEQIPIPLLPAPASDRGVRNAVNAAMNWLENRSWVAGQGGGFYYRGCYFTYIVSDPQWLMAMGLAYNAVVALASDPAIPPEQRSHALEAWAELTGS